MCIFAVGAGLPPTSCNRMGISGVGLRAAAKPNVFGDGHSIFSCNSIVKDPRGLAVGGSRNARKVACGAGPLWPSRTLPIPDVFIRKLLGG